MKRTLLTLAFALCAHAQINMPGPPTRRVATLPEYLKGRVQEDQAPTYIYLPARPQPAPVVYNNIYVQQPYYGYPGWYGGYYPAPVRYSPTPIYGFAGYPALPIILPYGW